MHQFKLLFLITLGTIVASCNPPAPQNNANKLPSIDTVKITAHFDKGDPISEEALVEGNTSFAFDLFKAIHDAESNLIFSPYSLSTAFAMTYGGAQGETEATMYQTLSFPQKNTIEFHNAVKLLNEKVLANTEGSVTLNTANKIWKLPKFPVEEGYLEMSKAYYKTPIGHYIDKKDGMEKINAWVSEKTNNKINDLLKESHLTNVPMVLTNAIYFFGGWDKEFNKEKTTEMPFILENGDSVKTDFMIEEMPCKSIEYEDYIVLELFYKDKKASMLIVLPWEGKTLSEIIPTLSSEDYPLWIKELRQNKFTVVLPKFKLAPPTIPLRDVFVEKLDMDIPFNVGGKADFGKLTSVDDFYIGNVFHKAFIEVNEEGTEAAAVTGITFETRSSAGAEPLMMNRPFLFMIKENSTNSILFMGQVTNPKK